MICSVLRTIIMLIRHIKGQHRIIKFQFSTFLTPFIQTCLRTVEGWIEKWRTWKKKKKWKVESCFFVCFGFQYNNFRGIIQHLKIIQSTWDINSLLENTRNSHWETLRGGSRIWVQLYSSKSIMCLTSLSVLFFSWRELGGLTSQFRISIGTHMGSHHNVAASWRCCASSVLILSPYLFETKVQLAV